MRICKYVYVCCSDGPRCRALFNYDSVSVGDLQFQTGEMIRLLRKVSDEWFEGETIEGRRGMFPVNFVEIIQNLPATNSHSSGGVRTGWFRIVKGCSRVFSTSNLKLSHTRCRWGGDRRAFRSKNIVFIQQWGTIVITRTIDIFSVISSRIRSRISFYWSKKRVESTMTEQNNRE